MDKNLNNLLKWGIENSTGEPQASSPDKASNLTPDVIASLFGGPSEAELMKASMEIISTTDSDVSLDDKLIAFDNFEQLIESLDNANNLANLSLWTPLLNCLNHDEKEIRRMAAWCVGTAVQNNASSQERLLAMGGIPLLVEIATKDSEHQDVRRKAIYALSSACRNYQPAMDMCTEELSKKGKVHGTVDAQDMDAVDGVMGPLKAAALKSE